MFSLSHKILPLWQINLFSHLVGRIYLVLPGRAGWEGCTCSAGAESCPRRAAEASVTRRWWAKMWSWSWVSFHPTRHLTSTFLCLKWLQSQAQWTSRLNTNQDFSLCKYFFWRLISPSTCWDTKHGSLLFIPSPLLSCSPDSAVMRQEAAKCLFSLPEVVLFNWMSSW